LLPKFCPDGAFVQPYYFKFKYFFKKHNDQMSRFFSYVNTASTIIENYKGETPLAIFLKKYFNISKKHGSSDRKQIAELVYNYYRVGNVLSDENLEDKILKASFLCSSELTKVIENLRPEWIDKIGETLEQKMEVTEAKFEDNDIFPLSNFISKSIDKSAFCKSFLQQPNLFLRIRPGFKDLIINKLIDENLHFELNGEDCLAFKNGTKVDQIFEVGKSVIVQDYSSQRVGHFVKKYINSDSKIWDCCAASGGKSIMLFDINNKVDLTVSDIRKSILDNLKERFTLAGIKRYKSFMADLTKHSETLSQKFDIILADVPCSGSGTWARTPEEKHFFTKEKIKDYTDLQYKIIENALPNLAENGLLIYITCSVFEAENEAQISQITKKLNLKLVEQNALIGYEKQADSMFLAILRKQ
jgi:16S rRNA (cytosine967-C5)-methyltransferase